MRLSIRTHLLLRERVLPNYDESFKKGFVILSEHRMYVSKPRVSTSECGVLWSVPLCRLRRTTVQLGAQTLVIEVDKNTAEWGPCGGPGAAPDWLLLYIGDTGWCAQLSQLINRKSARILI